MRSYLYITVMLSVVMLFFPMSVVFAHTSNAYVMDHHTMDSVSVTPEQEAAALKRASLQPFTAQAVATPRQAHIYGKWEGPYAWPVVAIHTALLSNGNVVSYDSVGDAPTESFQIHTFTRATLWNPETNSHVSGNVNLGYNIFCSGLAKLPNGQLFIAGGNKNAALEGINRLTNYNPFAAVPFVSQFSRAGTMVGERWYPSVTPLANGEMLISGGGPFTPEVRQFNGSIRSLFNVSDKFAANREYHWLRAAPNGKVAYLGPNKQLRYLDTVKGGAWQAAGNRDNLYRGYGSFAFYNVGRALVTGGGTPASASAVKVNLNTLAPTVTNNMKFARRQHNLTVLPDGKVLATGGFSGSAFAFDFGKAVYAAEVWNPATGGWKELANMKVHRGYHSIALLLPDGRILSAGGGICGGCLEGGYHQKNAEIFSPPYLFRNDGSGQLASRPTIANAPDSINPATSFNVATPEAADIRKVSLIRMSSVTHSVNMEQNYIPLSFTRGAGSLLVRAPASNNIASPGYYMMFLVNSAGVPSVAKIVKVNGGGTITVPVG